MASYSQSVKNLFGGVSQAPDTQRDASQFTELVNTLGTWGRRLGRRPGTTHVTTVNDAGFLHEFGKYTVTIADDGTVEVFERATGDAQAVNNFLTSAYLNDTASLRAINVGNTVYVLNTSIVVAKSAAVFVPSTAPYVAHVTVTAGDFETTYNVVLDGTNFSVTTPAASVAGAKAMTTTTVIANQLGVAITTGGLYTVTQYGSTLAIRRVTNADFTVTTNDGLGDKGLSAVKDTTRTAENLPQYADALTVVEIIGEDGTDTDNYFVQYLNGAWHECTAPGEEYILDPDTLPVKIEFISGAFDVNPVDWDLRAAGDATTNPFPSFVGHTLNDLFVYTGRLGFISGPRVSLSEAGRLTNFFRTTATQILASDPIDVDGIISGATDFAHALNWRGAVYLFTDRAQYILAGGRDGLTADSISVTQASAYMSDTSVRPIVAGQRIFFTVQENGASHVMDYHIKPYVDEHEAIDLCVNVPTYIQGTPALMVADEALGLLFLSTSYGIYVYAFRDTNDGRVQSAWSLWFLSGGVVRGMSLVDRTLTLVRSYFDGLTCLEVLHINDGVVGTQTFTGYDTFGGSFSANGSHDFDGGASTVLDVLGDNIALDRKVLWEAGLSFSYSLTTGYSEWTLPYTVPLNGSEGILAAWDVTTGQHVQLGRPAPNKVSALGDYTGHVLMFGTLFDTEIDLSTFFERDRNGEVDDRGRLQVRYATFDTTDTNELDVWVEQAGRNAVGYSLRRPLPTAGPFTFPVQGRNTDTRISILIRGPGACFLTGYSWEATSHARVPRR